MSHTASKLSAITLSAALVLTLAAGARAAEVAKRVETCTLCHGKDGVSTESDVPTIAGQSADYLSDTMAAYKKKDRACPETKFKSGPKKGTKTDMCQIMKDLNEGELKELGQYYAKKKFVRAAQRTDPALAARGKKLHDEYCEKCHSEGGSSPKDDSGVLAGQWMPYLEEQLNEFFAGRRVPPKKMKVQLDKLDKKAIGPLVNYYAGQK